MNGTKTPEKSVKATRSEEERKEEWLNEEIMIEFMNLEEPGAPVKFPFGTTRKNKIYTLMHGGKYRLPRRVVTHIESRQTPIWGYRPDGKGQMEKNLEGYKSRFQCRQIFE